MWGRLSRPDCIRGPHEVNSLLESAATSRLERDRALGLQLSAWGRFRIIPARMDQRIRKWQG